MAEQAFEVVLASASPRRRELLEKAGVAFSVRTPVTPVDETLEPDQLAEPAEACKKLAERKAGAVIQEVLAEDYQGMLIVIGADTMVVKDGRSSGSPEASPTASTCCAACQVRLTRSSPRCRCGWSPRPRRTTSPWDFGRFTT